MAGGQVLWLCNLRPLTPKLLLAKHHHNGVVVRKNGSENCVVIHGL